MEFRGPSLQPRRGCNSRGNGQSRNGGRYGPPRSQCQASFRSPVRGSRSGLNWSRDSGKPTDRPYAISCSRSIETRCAIGRPNQVWRCSQSPPSIAWIMPSRRCANSLHGGRPAEVGLAHATCVLYWQPISPSIVAGASGETLPAKIAQVSGNEAGCRRARGPTGRCAAMNVNRDTGRGREIEPRPVGRVGPLVEHVCLFGGRQVVQVRLQGGRVRLALRVLELGNRDGCENPNDHDDDQQFDQSEACAAFHVLFRERSSCCGQRQHN